MDHRFLALALSLAALYAPTASALYVQAGPPAGWSGGANSGLWLGSANPSASYTGSQIRAMASINMQGRSYALASSFKLAPSAARTAAAFVMANPYIRTAATVAGWLGLAGLVYDATSGLWSVPGQTSSYPVSDGDTWGYGSSSAVYQTKEQACAGFHAAQSASPTLPYPVAGYEVVGTTCYVHSIYSQRYYNIGLRRVASSSCPNGWYVTPAGCVQTAPPKTVTPEEAVEEIIKHPMPADLPRHIPTPLPVDTPEIQPVFIPTGDPVPNPSFDPSKAPSTSNPPSVQPGVDVKPAPTPGNPWQVDVLPVNRPIPDPTAIPDRDPVPLPDPNGSGDPPTDNKPREDADFCALNPTVLACQELKHEEDDIKLPTKAIEFEFNPIPGFQGSKTCPAFPNVGNLLGGKQISWQPFCDSLAKISNLLLAFAWASAAFIILGYGRGD